MCCEMGDYHRLGAHEETSFPNQVDGISGNEGEKVWVVMGKKKISDVLPHSVRKPGFQGEQVASEPELGS